MKGELDAIGQHHVFGDFVDLLEGRRLSQVAGYVKSSVMEQAICCGLRPG